MGRTKLLMLNASICYEHREKLHRKESDWNNVNSGNVYHDTSADPGGKRGHAPSGPVKYVKKRWPPKIAL